MTPHEISQALDGLQEELNRKREKFRPLGINVHRLAAHLEDLAVAFNCLHDQEWHEREADAYDGEQADGSYR